MDVFSVASVYLVNIQHNVESTNKCWDVIQQGNVFWNYEWIALTLVIIVYVIWNVNNCVLHFKHSFAWLTLINTFHAILLLVHRVLVEYILVSFTSTIHCDLIWQCKIKYLGNLRKESGYLNSFKYLRSLCYCNIISKTGNKIIFLDLNHILFIWFFK